METKLENYENKAAIRGMKFDEDYDWLEIGEIPLITTNKLLSGELVENPVEFLIKIFSNPNYLSFTCKWLLGVELLPFQMVILDMFWNRRLPILIASRGSGKTFIMAIYIILRLLLHPGCKIVVVGAAFRQPKNLFDYIVAVWDACPILQDICGRGSGAKRSIDRYEFIIGRSVAYFIPLGTGEKIRGLRANYIIVDEFDSVPEEIFNIVVQGFGVSAFDPVSKVKESAMLKKLIESGKWTDDMERARLKAAGGNQIIVAGTMSYQFRPLYKRFAKWSKIIKSKGDQKVIRDILGDDQGLNKGFDWRDYAVLRIPFNYVPTGLLDEGILSQAKISSTHNQFLMEYGCISPADSDGFFKRSTIESATTNKPITLMNGETVQFSSMRVGDPSKTYMIGVDPAADADNAAIVVIENNISHRRVVYCWTTNRKRYGELKKFLQKNNMSTGNEDYYRYIAKKIRSLMRNFNTESIVMDKNGGGLAIAENLGSTHGLENGELPIFEEIDPEKEKNSDFLNGLHILELLSPNLEFNNEANHGLLKDIQDKAILFPMFDTVEIEKSVALDKINDIEFDTYEELVFEIEELKSEMTSIVVTPSPTLGKERFDTPSIKLEGMKKGRLRKDRYSALLYVNFKMRSKGKNEMVKIDYSPMGGTREMIKTSSSRTNDNEGMYTGPGAIKLGQNKWFKNGNSSLISSGFYQPRGR